MWPRHLSRLDWLFAAAAAAILAAAVAVVMIAPLNIDAAWMLVEARRLLGGERLYVDMMETNPPLIVWLSTVPALVTTLGVSDQRAMGLSVAALLGGATALAMSVLGQDPAPPRSARLLLVACFLTTTAVFCAWDMGQREQIAAIATFPYTLLAGRTIAGGRPSTRLSAACGALAAVGFAIKPFFLGAFVAIELAVAATAGWRRTLARVDLLVVVVFQAAYVLVVLVAMPEYAGHILPAVAATYGAYGSGIQAVIRGNRFWLPGLVGLLALSASAVPGPVLPRAWSRVLGAATLGWLAGYAAQGKGWRYHFIPVLVYAALAIAATVAQLTAALPTLRQRPAWSRAAGAAAALVLLCVCAGAASGGWQAVRTNLMALSDRDQGGIRMLADMVGQLAPGEPVYVLSTSMSPAFPMVNLAGAQWPYHYHFLWLIPGLYPGRTGTPIPYRLPDAQGPMERAFFETVVTDLQRIPPRLLIVDRSKDQQGMAYGRPFDFVRYFSGSKGFLDLMQEYTLLVVVGPYAIYERGPLTR